MACIANELNTKTLCRKSTSASDQKVEWGVLSKHNDAIIHNPDICKECREVLLQIMRGE